MVAPMRVYGSWSDGVVMDYHTRNSDYIGVDNYGHSQFSTERTELGELIYNMKYKGYYGLSRKAVEFCSDFLNKWIDESDIDLVVPVPPTTKRDVQPVEELAKEIAYKYGLLYDGAILRNDSVRSSKDRRGSQENFDTIISASKSLTEKHTVLLVDDIYRTGSTANACTKKLQQDAMVKEVLFLAFTRTRK